MLRGILLSIGRLAERGLERIGRRDSAPVLDPYIGYEAQDGWKLRARVLTNLRRTSPVPEQSRWTNLRQMVSLFVTNEVADVPVEAAGIRALSDAEGYVDLTVPPEAVTGSAGPKAARETGPWAEIEARVAAPDGARALLPVRRIGAPDFLVISDIDDTMMQTGAHSLWRNLWTTFTGSALTRSVYPDAVTLMRILSDGERNPVFYVSSSPWNMHAFLQRVFALAGLPRGPVFLRDLGLSASGGIGKGHLGHKGAAIDTILADVPGVPVYLLGDTGQKDAVVYRTAIERHPGRVLGVALRDPAPGVGLDDAAEIAAIEQAGVPCYQGADFGGAPTHWGLSGPS